MRIERVTFQNQSGRTLAGVLELPPDRHPHNVALFAHCFACGKGLGAVRHIGRALTSAGFAMLRFDFTGLGESEGEFRESTFSANVDDLLSAAAYLETEHVAPSVLIGHSLGGAAVLAAAGRIASVRAVATIGAPFDPEHVTRLFTDRAADIDHDGAAEVSIGGRPFVITREFVADLKQRDSAATLRQLRCALLILHSPQDAIVSIDNAASIYQAARHPKSFITLDWADHLLSRAEDAVYTGEIIAAWAGRYIERPAAPVLRTEQQVAVRIDNAPGYTTQILAGGHGLVADEPAAAGGNGFGPNPYDLLVSALGACTAMTLKMYAARKRWTLNEITVHLTHDKIHMDDCDCDLDGDPRGRLDRIQRRLEIDGDLDPDQRQRLLEIADRCPVHRTLEGDILIRTEAS